MSSTHAIAELFADSTRQALGETSPAANWLTDTLTAVHEHGPDRKLLAAFAGAGRRVGATAVTAKASDRQRLAQLAEGAPWPEHAGSAELARIALLLASFGGAAAPSSDLAVEVIADLYYKGAIGEQNAVLHALCFLPDPKQHVELAIDACRTNAVSTFAAIASHNAYPARFFPELHFNQLVTKAMFLDVPTADIHRLVDRVNPDLGRMLDDFAAERRAAGRPLPPDLEQVRQLCPETSA